MPHRLLLADDSETIRRVIELTFSDEDIQVTAVGDGQQAIDRIREQPPDIVLTDVTMPERDGYEVAAFIKEDPALAHIPVVLLTGAYEPVDEARARAIGCDGVMVKPFEPQMVIKRVRELLEGKRPAALWTTSASLDQRDAVGTDPALEPGAAGPALAATGTDTSEVSSPSSESLDTYFDRLSDALGTLGDPPPTAAVESAVPVETPVEPMEAAPSAVDPPTQESGIVPPARPASSPPPPAAGLSLGEMFSVLLAAEQQWSASPGAPGDRAAASRATERLVADITRRVLDQVTDHAVRDTVSRAVAEVAERLVREEIERINAVADADASSQR